MIHPPLARLNLPVWFKAISQGTVGSSGVQGKFKDVTNRCLLEAANAMLNLANMFIQLVTSHTPVNIRVNVMDCT